MVEDGNVFAPYPTKVCSLPSSGQRSSTNFRSLSIPAKGREVGHACSERSVASCENSTFKLGLADERLV